MLGEGILHTCGNTARSGLTFRASAPETGDPTLPPNRTVKDTEEKEVSASHLASDVVPLNFPAIGAGTP